MENKIPNEEINKIRALPMLFILGKDRSGTTLLQTTLDAHPNIVGPHESKFMMTLYPRFRNIKHWEEKHIHQFLQAINQYPFFDRQWNIDKEVLKKYLFSALDDLDYALACKIVYYQKRRGKENIMLISDKNPDYVLFAHKLLVLYPTAKFIHIIRHPKDNILSRFNVDKAANFYFNAYKWTGFNSIVETLKKKHPEKFFTILYEKFTGNPEATLIPLCNFLGVHYYPEMMKPTMPDEMLTNKVAMERYNNNQKMLYSGISTSSIGKWRKELKISDAAVIEKITGQYGKEKYGYDLDLTPGDLATVPAFKVFKWKYLYKLWQAFTRFRYTSMRINLIYANRKIKKLRNKPAKWDYI